MYQGHDIVIITISAILVIGIYIYRKASGDMWYGVQWGRVFYEIRRWFCKILLKVCNK